MISYLITLLFLISTVESTTNHGIRLELAHRETLETKPKSSRIDKDTVGADKKRHSVITQKRNNVKGGAKMPLGSGAELGNAQYFTEVNIGTPPQKFRLVVDTGEELTMVNCRYREKGKADNRNVFRADASKSFTPIGCMTKTCKDDFSKRYTLTACLNPSNPCTADYSTPERPKSEAILGKETFTFGMTNGGEAKLEGVIIGCSDSYGGLSYEKTDGVLGLANSDIGFASVARSGFGPKFSYCLVDHRSSQNVTNFLILGGSSSTTQKTGPVQTAPLDLKLIPLHYAIDIVGISLGDKMLNIPPQVWDATTCGGTVLDTGTSLSFLAEEAYKVVTTELDRHIVGLKRINLTDELPMEYCYETPSGFDESKLPQLVFHFKSGARFEPYRKSYFVVTTEGIRCLGFLSSGKASNALGNIMQQNFLWEFDLAASTLSFAPSTCTN